MKSILSKLKKYRLLNFFRRVWLASKYYNKKYSQILSWGLKSREDTNFTYHITEDNLKYLALLISSVTQKPYEQIRGYFSELQSNETLKKDINEAVSRSSEKNVADREVKYGRRIGWYALVRAIKPKLVVETGVDKGLGSVVLCTALLKNKDEGHEGHYFGTDINPKAGYLLSGVYTDVGRILYGDSLESLSQLEEKIDLFINDSDHSANYEYAEYKTITRLLTDQSIIIGDNAHVSSKLADYSLETGRKFLFLNEVPKNHWYPGAGIGISFKDPTQ